MLFVYRMSPEYGQTGHWAYSYEVAEGIAVADGKTWGLLDAAERDRYDDLAKAALESAGMQRDDGKL